MKRAINKKGYIIVEAAIFLPVFILAVVSIICYINVFAVKEGVAYSAIEETARLASKAYIVKAAPGFPATVKYRVENDNPGADDVSIGRFRYLYRDDGLDNIIDVSIKYDVGFSLPLGFGHEIPLEEGIKCRGFTGLRKTGTPMSFEEMESEGIWEPVWIFPDSGEKYHSDSCTYVKANAKELVLTAAVEAKYDPCSACGAGEVIAGSFVYCFPENGTVYHRSDCRHVDRYTIEINKTDALDKGYKPCSKCGGG